jgi:dihydrofolate synthase/folylpolyglutamate synthase
MSRDKDVANLIPLLAPCFAEVWLTRYGSSSRGAEPAALAELWRKAGGGPHHLAETPEAAWRAARLAASPEDLICVAGSVFLAGELRDRIRSSCRRQQA